MIVLISPAKTFSDISKVEYDKSIDSVAHFEKESFRVVDAALKMNAKDLRKQLSTSAKVFDESVRALSSFMDDRITDKLPSLLAYSGMVFKKIRAKDFSKTDWSWANSHILITSFVYGLLKPSDIIKKYRMEGTAVLPELYDGKVFDFWKPMLTNMFIERIKENGGELLFLASQEMKNLFEWGRVEKQVRVVEPMFNTIKEGGEVKQIVIYTKMCRGSMLREIVKNQINDIDSVKSLCPEGFSFSENDSDESIWNYYRMDIGSK